MKTSYRVLLAAMMAAAGVLVSGTAAFAAETTINGTVSSINGDTMVVASGNGSVTVDLSRSSVRGNLSTGATVRLSGTTSGAVLDASQVAVL